MHGSCPHVVLLAYNGTNLLVTASDLNCLMAFVEEGITQIDEAIT